MRSTEINAKKIAVIGDIHGFWDSADTKYFNQSDYDALLFVGDLPRLTGSLDVARELAKLEKPAWLIPGNHDGCTIPQLLGEIKGWKTLCRAGAIGMSRRVNKLARALEPVRLAAYESFALNNQTGLIVARPHAMGPDRFYYREYLNQRYGVDNFTASANKLMALVDTSPQNIVFMAHNGPAGLGASSTDIWGCDFSPEFGDFGDPDLRQAITYAKETGRHVLCVLAGHMHLRSKTGERRRSAVRQEDTLYINAAEVARIRHKGEWRHHVQLTINADSADARQICVNAEGRIIENQQLP